MKRWMVRICEFLLLGAIVNVAVAWASAASIHLADWRDVDAKHDVFNNWGDLPDFDMYTAHLWQKPTGMRLELFRLSGYSGMPFANTMSMRAIVPSWATSFVAVAGLDGVEVEDDYDAFRYVDAHGWPCTSLWGGIWWPQRVWSPSKGNAYAYWSIPLCEINGATNLQAENVRMIPLRPIWPGFAINTVFYAAVLWGLFAAPVALRRRLRRKRGLCPACGYDLRGRVSGGAAAGRVCPECGAAAQ